MFSSLLWYSLRVVKVKGRFWTEVSLWGAYWASGISLKPTRSFLPKLHNTRLKAMKKGFRIIRREGRDYKKYFRGRIRWGFSLSQSPQRIRKYLLRIYSLKGPFWKEIINKIKLSFKSTRFKVATFEKNIY